MLKAKNITVSIGNKKLLQDVSVSIIPGEILAIIDSNGAGKSTLLKSLCGDIVPDAGSIIMNNRRLDKWTVHERAKIRAVLPQNSNLTFPFSVRDVVLMGRSPYCTYKESQHDRRFVNEAMNAVEIIHLQHRQYQTLSGGEQQRVHLARILAQVWEPTSTGSRYLLLDEPTSVLDLTHQHETLTLAHLLAKKQQLGILVILHDLNLSALYANKIALLKAGRLLAWGDPKSVLTEQNILNGFDYSVLISQYPKTENCPLVIPKLSPIAPIEKLLINSTLLD